MRVAGGRLRGRLLAGPTDEAIRPTADRLRAAIFDILAHSYGDPVRGARVLDLFCGTGALAIEALSRGAASATLVDADGAACALARRNLVALGLADAARVIRRDAGRLGPAEAGSAVALVFCDPPYGHELAPAALARAAAAGWIAPGALAVVEERPGAFLPPSGFAESERRRYGAAEITIGWLGGTGPSGDAGAEQVEHADDPDRQP